VIDKGDYYPLWLQRWDGEQDPLPRQARAECLGGDSVLLLLREIVGN